MSASHFAAMTVSVCTIIKFNTHFNYVESSLASATIKFLARLLQPLLPFSREPFQVKTATTAAAAT
jgi:hypothetical protein